MRDTEPSADFITVPEACARTGIVRPFRRAVQRGEVPSYDLGGWRRVRWSDVLAWIESRRVRSTPHAEARLREVLGRDAR